MDIDIILKRLVQVLETYHSEQNEGTFVHYQSSKDLRRALSFDTSSLHGDWDEIFLWLEKYLHYSVKTGHHSFVNRMWADANLPSILGEIVSAFSNTSACTYEAAPVSTVMEQYLIEQMLSLVGFVAGEGQMTTGSSNANMIAMLAARNRYGQHLKDKGLFNHKTLFAFVSEESHYSLDKAANIIGIGTEHLIKIPLDTHGRMDVRALEEAIICVKNEGGVPFFVCATAGTTVRGAYDSIVQIEQLRKSYSFWLHVDGAWGGAVLFDKQLRSDFLTGIESVDSFTCDFHKMLGTNLICNVLLVNHCPGILGETCAVGDASYIFRENSEQVRDLGSISLQCGRKVDSLKWFLDWKFYGAEGFGLRVKKLYELCCYAEEVVLGTDELEMVAPRESFNICFRYRTNDEKTVSSFNRMLRKRLYEDGTSLVGFGYLQGQLALRLLITHSGFTRHDVDHFFDTLVETARKMIKNKDHEKFD